MEYVNLGRTGCKISRLCLGTMNFGPRTPEPDAHAIMSRAFELGVQFWDTADVYGGKTGEGITEQIIGNWLSGNSAKRDQIVLATKFQGTMGTGPNDRGASAFHIRQACEASLRRLKTDHIDLYQMHHVNRDCAWEEVFGALEMLRLQGKIVYAGGSNYAGWHIAQAAEAAKQVGVLGMVAEQSKFSLDCRFIELEVLPACRHYGLAMIPWSPLSGGILGGVLSGDKGIRRASAQETRKIDLFRPHLEKWEALCKETGERPADMALAWMLHIPGVTAPIIGPRTLAQLDESQRALAIKLAPEQMAKIDEIWPPIRHIDAIHFQKNAFRHESPEAYAW